MFALGFVPVAYSATQKTVSPVLLVGVILIVSVSRSWLEHPLTAPQGSPTPFGVYIFLWVGVVLLAGLAGDIERTLRERETA